MEFSEWLDQYSVNDPLMDSYHHIFFQEVELIEHVAAEGDLESAKERITFLLTYANMHFDAEETVMARAGYPELEHHRSLHMVFRRRIHGFQQQIKDNPNSDLILEISRTVRQWWMEHILHEDMKYAPYLKQQVILT